jgi:hypothetical protein
MASESDRADGADIACRNRRLASDRFAESRAWFAAKHPDREPNQTPEKSKAAAGDRRRP